MVRLQTWVKKTFVSRQVWSDIEDLVAFGLESFKNVDVPPGISSQSEETGPSADSLYHIILLS